MSEQQQTSQEVVDFYNDFAKTQLKSGANIRIKRIFLELMKLGLNKKSNVLEIGCGIGLLSEMICKVVKAGKVVGTDISPECISAAQLRNKNNSNAEFIVTDLNNFNSKVKFDFVVLADVLEHIPVVNHNSLFKIIDANTDLQVKILINIPTPFHIEYLRQQKPESLQIIDQALHLDLILPAFVNNGFYVSQIFSYSLWHNFEDYQFILLRKKGLNNNPSFKPRSQLRLNELKYRIKFAIKSVFK